MTKRHSPISLRRAGCFPAVARLRRLPAPRCSASLSSSRVAETGAALMRQAPASKQMNTPLTAQRRLAAAHRLAAQAAKVRHDEQYKKWDEAAKRAMGSICMGCGGETAPPPKRAQKPPKKSRKAG